MFSRCSLKQQTSQTIIIVYIKVTKEFSQVKEGGIFLLCGETSAYFFRGEGLREG